MYAENKFLTKKVKLLILNLYIYISCALEQCLDRKLQDLTKYPAQRVLHNFIQIKF